MKETKIINRCCRRRFFGRTFALAAAYGLPGRLWASEHPPVINPRSTSSDTSHEPDWQQRITVTVAHEKADMNGDSDKVIQAAVDYVARLGGGTVHLMPGTYTMRAPVHLRPHVRLLGSGTDTVLRKSDMVKSKLSADSDWYDQEITLVDASGFKVGDAVMLIASSPRTGKGEYLRRRLVAQSGNRFKLDRALYKDFWLRGNAVATTISPVIQADETSDVTVENMRLDGNRANNDHIDGNYCGCIFAQDCIRMNFRGLDIGNYHGDGISHQICHDVHIKRCHIHDNTGLALHVGSGSQRPVIRHNTLRHNNTGVYFCWGIKFGLVEENKMDANGYGFSIGHHDTDNWIRNNHISNSINTGAVFRSERGKGYSADRNLFEGNQIIDSGNDNGVGIDVQGYTTDVTVRNNLIRETRAPANRIGIRLGRHVGKIDLTDNRMEGLATKIKDCRNI